MRVSFSRTLSDLNDLDCAGFIEPAHLEGIAFTISLAAKRLRKTPSALCKRLRGARCAKTFAEAVQQILYEVPPPRYPPERLGGLHRVDDGNELIDFAKRTRNYENLEADVAWGLFVAYRSPSNLDAMYLLQRRGRLEWFFSGTLLARRASHSNVETANAGKAFARNGFSDGTKSFLTYQFLYNQLGYHDVPGLKSLSIPVFL